MFARRLVPQLAQKGSRQGLRRQSTYDDANRIADAITSAGQHIGSAIFLSTLASIFFTKDVRIVGSVKTTHSHV